MRISRFPSSRTASPFRALAIVMRQREFLRLLNVQDIPRNWLAGIIDSQGTIIALVPGAEDGGSLPKGGALPKIKRGCSNLISIEGEALIRANARPSIGNWTVGVAVKKASCVRQLGSRCAGLSCWELAFLQRAYCSPGAWPATHSAHRSTARGVCGRSTEPTKPVATGPPEILERRTRSTVRRSSGQTRTNRSRRPSPILSVRWRCARRHRPRWRKRSAWRPSASLPAALRTTSTMCWRRSPPTWMRSRFAALTRRSGR